MGGGGSEGRGYMYTLWLTLVVQQKPTQHCEAITFQLKVKIIIKKKKKKHFSSSHCPQDQVQAPHH